MNKVIIILLWIVLFAGLCFFTLTSYETSSRVEAKAAGSFPAGGMSRIWFSSEGDLIGIVSGDWDVTVRVRANAGAGPQRERTFPFEHPENRTPDKKSTTVVAAPIYAIADDGSKIAWIRGGGVRVDNLFAPGAKSGVEYSFKRTVSVVGLAFTGSGALAVLYSDGELELWDLVKDKVSAAKHLSLDDPGPILTSGAYVAVYSPSTSDVYVFDTGGGEKLSLLEYKKYRADILATTLSPQGKFATGTRERVEQHGYSLNAPGTVRALAFYDRDRVLVAGGFPDVYVLSPTLGPQRIAPSEPGTKLLANNGAYLAAGDGVKVNLFSLKLLQVRTYTGMARPWLYIALALLGLITPVAIYFGSDLKLLRQRKLRGQMDEAESGRREEEGPIPNVLIEACQNGDCILYAGSGLSAQAGLPAWQAFAAELAQWAGDSAGGDADSVMDRIAAAFKNRERELIDYLRTRFRVTSEISQAHRLVKEIDFPVVITTTMDNLLDRTFPYSGGRVHTVENCTGLMQAASRRDFFLLKLFGDLGEPDTVRLGPRQCLQMIGDYPALREELGGLLHSNTFLFLGASVEALERDLENLGLEPQAGRRHFILVPDVGEAWKAPADRIHQRYGIETLTYVPLTSEHPEVVEFLTNLIAAMRAKSDTESYFVAESRS